ncbi:hypothetical protein BDN71DRAFT_1441435 [Pleurotus eryngii]|uniref:Uncharacterized protein n=1 Tax=Pleurotus eryngii TaxID=5323 RepID=A0A9P6A587_PLEER|nr:hypothetical protein BDN71DRAFT_1441435 [Pleurotus eryngii]
MTNQPPPYYILFSHSSVAATSSAANQSNTLAHPVIQYQYADDSPLSLLPQSPDEHVLILDYDPSSQLPVVRSASHEMVVTGLKVAEAPGAAAAAEEGGPPRNDRMYIIETTSKEDRPAVDPSQGERVSPQTVLAQFKQRNAVLRRALDYPNNTTAP